MKKYWLLFLVLFSCHSLGDVAEAKSALSAGDYPKAVELFAPLANAGDLRAAITLGNIYYEGKPKVKRNYDTAYDWYLKAFLGGDGDAMNNIGVMFRDGKGVAKNRQIAYLLFLLVNRANIGGDNTQIRAFSNLNKEMAEQKTEDLQQALCFTYGYMLEHVKTKGALQGIPDELKPTDKKPSFKNAKFWSAAEKEQLNFSCAP